MTTLTKGQRRWVDGHWVDVPDKPCPLGCGAAFFTNVGLTEHARLGCNGHGSQVTVRRRWWMTPEGRAFLAQRGREVTALINAKRVRCGQCDVVSTPGPLATHQRASGHTGRVELA